MLKLGAEFYLLLHTSHVYLRLCMGLKNSVEILDCLASIEMT